MGMETIAEFVENDEIKACSERSMLTMRKAMVSVSQCHLPTYRKIKIDNSFNVSHIHHFQPEPDEVELPIKLNNPFNNRPHALAILAANLLQKQLDQTPALSVKLSGDDCGKMFGVLVVTNDSGKTGYLASFSGMLNQQWIVPGFVPPVFDIEEQMNFLREGEAQLLEISSAIEKCLNNPARLEVIHQLSNLKQQSETELAALKLLNQDNKKLRHSRRNATHIEEKLLQELSLSSQSDKKAYKQLKLAWLEKQQQRRDLFNSNFEDELNRLKATRKQLSQALHTRVFDSYQFKNGLGEVASIKSLFEGKTPPGGTGDCAAPKLFQYAFQNKLRPLALAEFWYGGAPLEGVRHHKEFYPPCRGKCHPIMPFLLKGQGVEPNLLVSADRGLQPEVVYEDADIVVINKPAGLLSIPGKTQDYSVSSWLADQYSEADGLLLVHRLDMATSGLLLAAKNAHAHKILQQQFIARSVEKRYVAVLAKALDPDVEIIDLPLRVDLDDRPRQMVCYQHGKKAITQVEVISTDDQVSRVYFYPLTGRTHQLRVHAAHSKGLAAPIVGDALYGVAAERMMLHAEKLGFYHPQTNKRMTIKSEVPF